MTVRGADVRFRSPHDAYAAGIATIYQDLALAPRARDLAERLPRRGVDARFGLLDKARMRADAASYMARLGVRIADMDAPVRTLSGGQRQAVAISRALRWNAELIVMDEPTAALGVKETAQVLDLIRRLKARRHDRHPGQPQHGRCGRGREPRRDLQERTQGDRPRGRGARCRQAGAYGDDGTQLRG